MPWWGWLVLGAALLGAEVVVQTEFWLAVVGAAALCLGLLLTIGFVPPTWVQWAAFGALATLFNVLFRQRIYRKLVARAPGIAAALEGETAVALERIEAGAVGPVELRGSRWRARNVGSVPIDANADARVVGRNGVLLEVSA